MCFAQKLFFKLPERAKETDMSRLLLCDVRGPVGDLLQKLSGDEGEEWFGVLKKMLRKENPWDEEKSEILVKVGTVSVPAVSSFVMDETTQKRANIGWLGNNFHDNFFGKTEEGVAETTLVLHRLEKNFLDKPIIAQLGEKTEISLAHFIELIEKQANGQKGELLVNGYANIAYIHDKIGNLWAVDACWYSLGVDWLVNARSVDNQHGWGAGGQLVSRDS